MRIPSLDPASLVWDIYAITRSSEEVLKLVSSLEDTCQPPYFPGKFYLNGPTPSHTLFVYFLETYHPHLSK